MKNQLVLKELSTAEVQERLDVERALLQKMKINHAISPIENPNKIKESRHSRPARGNAQRLSP